MNSGALSLAHPGAPGVTADWSEGQPHQSVLEALRASLGEVPRVLLRDMQDEPEAPVVRPSSPERPEDPGRYQIAGEIGHGGMGAVFKGRDPDLGRDLAIKVLLEKWHDDPDVGRRFIEEAQIGGQLQHPGIVPVYELGSFENGRPYFTMKLLKGRTLAALLSERGLAHRANPPHPNPPPQRGEGVPNSSPLVGEDIGGGARAPRPMRATTSSPLVGEDIRGGVGAAADLPRFLSIFEGVCQTVAYAHARGVIHRDLKPSNIMAGSFGEVQVLDWGLAKVLPQGGVADESPDHPDEAALSVIRTMRTGSDADASRPGSFLGTPAYVAPEQANGEVESIDERADVFGLGSILCEILTGKPAYTGPSGQAIQRKAMRGETADALRRLDGCGADAELIGLARNCLAVEPEERPRDAGEIVRRLTAYLAGVQERLRAAELARAAEAARAEEAQATAAAAEKARAAEEARAEENEATLLRDQAAAAPDDVAKWEAADKGVEAAGNALAEAGEPQPAIRLMALRNAVQAGLVAARRDQSLLDTLADVRTSKQDLGLAGADAAYTRAFRDAGLDVDASPPAEIGSILKARPPSVAVAAAAALDDWALVRRQDHQPEARQHPPLHVARAVDPDPFRDQVRASLMDPDVKAREAALRTLAADPKAALLPPPSAVLLSAALRDLNAVEPAIALLRAVVGRHPDDIGANYVLADALTTLRPAAREEAVRYYTAARSLRPEAAHVLAHLLDDMGRGDEALAVFADLTARRPDYPGHLGCYGSCLKARGRPEAAEILDRAVAAGRAAIRLKPDSAGAHSDLGNALSDQGNIEEAIAVYREAIRLRPDSAVARSNLGVVLSDEKHKTDAAIAEFRAAIRLEPGYALVHRNLGSTLCDERRDYDGAVAEFREALRLKPDDALAHHYLGNALNGRGKPDDAIAEYRAATRPKPDYARAHFALGHALERQGKLDDAIAEYRAAVRLKPDYAEAHCNLALALRGTGDYAESLAEIRKGHELGSKRPGWRYPSARWVADAERAVALAPRLPAVLQGEDMPKDAAGGLALALMAYDRKHFAVAARLWAGALDGDPKLGDDRKAQHRYSAACAAALAAASQGKDDPPPDAPTRAKLRSQSLGSLKAELAAWAKFADSGQPQANAMAVQALERWKKDPDLASIRDADTLAKLPDQERQAWRAVWAEVDALVRKAHVSNSGK